MTRKTLALSTRIGTKMTDAELAGLIMQDYIDSVASSVRGKNKKTSRDLTVVTTDIVTLMQLGIKALNADDPYKVVPYLEKYGWRLDEV